jgi:sensor domain CHASE-containing protein
MTERSQFGRREFFARRRGRRRRGAVRRRTAERIYTTLFGGEPYVQSSAPVVSTDDRITNVIGSRLG